MQQPARTRFVVVIVAITAVLLGVAFLLLHLVSPSDGARLAPGQPVLRPDGIVVTPIQEQPGGLRQGDVVVAVAGGRLEIWAQALFQPRAPRPHPPIVQTASFNAVRDAPPPGVPPALLTYPPLPPLLTDA